ncbi:hypothetical protein KJ644_05440 [Candidatus Dependentiae bacterium]|nr:hypothetical protein [Candidatus Dependentiae bacterium]MBU4387874.1 hypothetical protein [Candidatus Dependentiae bacterium]
MRKIYLFIFILFAKSLFASGINLSNSTVSFKVSSGVNLKLNYPISNVKGTIIKESGSVISGGSISIENGCFNEVNSESKINGLLDFSGTQKIYLTGNSILEGKRGDIFSYIVISGQDNIIQGNLNTLNDIDIQDGDSSVVINTHVRLDKNINLNGGEIKLGDDLHFLDDKRIIGPGLINLNSHRLSFGAKDLYWTENILFKDAADLEINSSLILDASWIFSGDSIICGNSNIIYLDSVDSILVRPNSTLLIRDAILYGVSENKLRCMADNSIISFQNTKIVLDNDFSFTVGSLIFGDNVEFIGKDKVFHYQSSMTSTIKDNAMVTLSNGVTFSYAPISGRDNLLYFEADDSTIYLNGANLYTAYTGLNLLGGRIIADKNSEILIESRDWVHATVTGTYLDEGITYSYYDYTYGHSGYLNIGNNSEESDFELEILSGAQLNFVTGDLYYKNVGAQSFKAFNEFSTLSFFAGTGLILYQDLTISPGKIVFNRSSRFEAQEGKKLFGSRFYV